MLLRLLPAALLALAAVLSAGSPALAQRPTDERFAVPDLPTPTLARLANGQPGPAYWQQRADYSIRVTLDPPIGTITGSETITYANNSPDTLAFVWIQLDQNLFAPGSGGAQVFPPEGRFGGGGFVGGYDIRSVISGGGTLDHTIRDTQMRVVLPAPLAPGSSVAIEIDWSFAVPENGADRMGRDEDLYLLAQWYPRMAVYDDVHGWNTDKYLGQGEFYLEYGDFEVAITAPEGWLIGASGELENADEVLTQDARDRIAQALAANDVVPVVTADDVAAGNATVREPGGQLTWRFRARNVRDFAFAASNRYVWDATRAIVPDADGDAQPDTVLVNALYRPAATAWREAARYIRHALTFHAQRWHPYPHPHITAAEGPIGGMEYPMLVFIGAPSDPQALYEVLSHEVAHQWWSMMVGSNETDYAWQDEGLTTYVENLSVASFFPDSDPFAASLRSYLAIAGTDAERPIMREADLFGPGSQYGVAAYQKPGALFHALAAIVGDRQLHAALRVYADRWMLKHPSPWDLFHTIEDVVGRDLDWFWHPWWYETAVLDQAIADVAITPGAAGETVVITVEDRGDAPMPVLLVVTLESGEARRVTVPVDVWLEGARRHRVELEVPDRVTRVEIDPEDVLLDVDRTNDVFAWGAQQR